MSTREGQPKGYVTQEIRRRVSRPLHAQRAAVLEQAESVFRKPDLPEPRTPLARWPRYQRAAPMSVEERARLTQLVPALPPGEDNGRF